MLRSITAYDSYLQEINILPLFEVILGSPKFADCRSLGICRILTYGALRNCDCEYLVKARINFDPPSGRLLLFVNGESIDAECYRKFFSTGNFRIEAPYKLGRKLSEQLGFQRLNYQIDPGEYPFIELDKYVALSLRLSTVMTVRQPLLQMAA